MLGGIQLPSPTTANPGSLGKRPRPCFARFVAGFGFAFLAFGVGFGVGFVVVRFAFVCFIFAVVLMEGTLTQRTLLAHDSCSLTINTGTLDDSRDVRIAHAEGITLETRSCPTAWSPGSSSSIGTRTSSAPRPTDSDCAVRWSRR